MVNFKYNEIYIIPHEDYIKTLQTESLLIVNCNPTTYSFEKNRKRKYMIIQPMQTKKITKLMSLVVKQFWTNIILLALFIS